MEKEIVEAVLIELLEETKKINVLIEEQNKEIQELKSSLSDFSRKLSEIKVPAPEVDLLPLTRIVTEGINEMQKIVTAQPKEVLHDVRAFRPGIKYFGQGATGSYQTGHLSCVVEIKDVNAGSSIAYLSNPGAYQSFLKDGKIVFFAGGNTFDIYDITTGIWSIGVLPADVNPSFAVSIGVNNTIYVAGGIVNGVVSNQVWKLEV